ncbi:hypothetical protein [Flavobacterium terrigena]|uniref:Uncharacterized protein n=1 Tax=Flavobacterium terrigena TaxID=402734 RepID=A0A1H6Y6Y7_9FLAO|nr:hypothetical protein [Flavobacterium terrigena]SEJ37043.1 hypothetical protein SAMN05660918_0148 [Flavobacterium terrigena]
MKKKIEGELISIAHRLLKLKNHTETIQLHEEVKKLYEQLTLLKFYEANTALVNEEFSEALFEEKVAKIVVGTIEVEDEEEEMMELASKEHIAQIEEELFEKNDISHEAFPGNGDIEVEMASKEHIAQIKEELFKKNDISHEAFPAKDTSTSSATEKEEVKEEVVAEETKNEVVEDKKEKKEMTSNPEIIGTKVSKQISMDDILVHDYQATMFVKKDEPIIEELIKEPVFEAVQPEVTLEEQEIPGEVKEELDKSDEVEVVTKEELVVKEEVVAEVKEEPTRGEAESSGAKTETVPTGKAIVLGLNDKIAFEKNLFAGNGDDLNRVISQLNTFTNWDEAKSFVLDFVKPDYNNWENKEEFEVRFLEIVENKFK